MRISTKGEYGVRALFDLAQREGKGPIQSASIAARQHVPDKYLSQLLLIMRKKGLIHSIRGPQGGHMLARPASDISLGEALSVLEGPLVPIDCVKADFSDCCLLEMCVIRDVWLELKAATDEVLYSTTLADLLHNQMERNAEVMYYI